MERFAVIVHSLSHRAAEHEAGHACRAPNVERATAHPKGSTAPLCLVVRGSRHQRQLRYRALLQRAHPVPRGEQVVHPTRPAPHPRYHGADASVHSLGRPAAPDGEPPTTSRARITTACGSFIATPTRRCNPWPDAPARSTRSGWISAGSASRCAGSRNERGARTVARRAAMDSRPRDEACGRAKAGGISSDLDGASGYLDATHETLLYAALRAHTPEPAKGPEGRRRHSAPGPVHSLDAVQSRTHRPQCIPSSVRQTVRFDPSLGHVELP